VNSGAHDAIFSDQNPFWQYSLKQYAVLGCAEFLLAAQEEQGLNVNHLLFLGFAAAQGQSVEKVLDPAICHWHQNQVIPIRILRKRIKAFNNQKFYEASKSLELYAEQVEQALFFSLQKRAQYQGSFSQCLKKSVEDWFKADKRRVDEAWLQALIHYLQPDAG
jgi:uncharacterized protein (TIGR02444 family)